MALQLFEQKDVVKICAPMVRYSRLPFRLLVRKYGCDLAYTPMIMADSFVKSKQARDEFTTVPSDRPLVVQFAANNAHDIALASELVAGHCDGVGINCGCPQRWALQEGVGCYLMRHPELIQDMIRQTHSRVPVQDFTISVKIRLHSDLRQTVELCRRAESAGASYLSVHARRVDQRREPADMSALSVLTSSVNIPVVANGDVRSLSHAREVTAETGAKGVMVARALLRNPALFEGWEYTPTCCVKDWVKISAQTGTLFPCFHHHLIYMCQDSISRAERRYFNVLSSTSAVMDYLNQHYFMEDNANSLSPDDVNS